MSTKLKRAPVPTEDAESMAFARWLDATGVLWCHVPNESAGPVQWQMKRKRMGVQPGVPDFLIFDHMPTPFRGIAIEMKRVRGGGVSKQQREWHEKLRGCGWLVYVARGALDASELVSTAMRGGLP